jgi:hypothetical protein
LRGRSRSGGSAIDEEYAQSNHRFERSHGGPIVTKSVLDAIREGNWDFEPDDVNEQGFSATRAIPGTREKLRVLAERVREGLPLWHDRDRADYEELAE